MKKLLSLLTAFIMLFGTTSVSIAKENNNVQSDNPIVNKDKALQIAAQKCKQWFNISVTDQTYRKDAVYLKDAWQINIQQNTSNHTISISLILNASTGEITYIQTWHDQPQTSSVALVSKEEAEKIALEFLKKVEPDKINEIKPVKYMDSNNYHPSEQLYYYFVRTHNNVPVQNNYINVVINSREKTAEGFNCMWQNIKFNNLINPIDANTAKLKIAPALKMELIYKDFGKCPKLVYEPVFAKGGNIDAQDGRILGYTGQPIDTLKFLTKDITAKEKQKILSTAKNNKMKKTVDEDYAKKIGSAFVKKYFGNNYNIQDVFDSSTQLGNTITYQWNVHFLAKTKQTTNVDIQIDKNTGNIISVTQSVNDSTESSSQKSAKPILTATAAYDKAMAIIKNECPQFINKIKTSQKIDTDINNNIYKYIYGENMVQQYNFYFPRIQDGIPFGTENDFLSGDGIVIGFNALTGKLNNYTLQWNDKLKFPSNKNIMNSEQAKELYLNKYNCQLSYLPDTYNIDNNQKNDTLTGKEVYSLGTDYDTCVYPQLKYIDAINGSFIDSFGNIINEKNQSSNTSAQDNWAQKAIQVFNDMGLVDSNVDSYSPIHKADLLKLILSIKGYDYYSREGFSDIKPEFTDISKDDDLYPYIQAGIKYGIIENQKIKFDPDIALTKEQMTIWLIKTAHFEDIAKKSDLFILNYKDLNLISKANIGYVAICKALDMLPDKDTFDPKNDATWADVEYALYNGLKYIKVENGF